MRTWEKAPPVHTSCLLTAWQFVFSNFNKSGFFLKLLAQFSSTRAHFEGHWRCYNMSKKLEPSQQKVYLYFRRKQIFWPFFFMFFRFTTLLYAGNKRYHQKLVLDCLYTFRGTRWCIYCYVYVWWLWEIPTRKKLERHKIAQCPVLHEQADFHFKTQSFCFKIADFSADTCPILIKECSPWSMITIFSRCVYVVTVWMHLLGEIHQNLQWSG